MATTLAGKLRLLPGQRALILNAPDTYRPLLEPLPEGVELATEGAGPFDFVHLFVRDSGELEQLGPAALSAVQYDGLLWISYPKKSSKVESDLTRDSLWDRMKPTGFRPVTQISVDDVWSALRFRPADAVGT